MRYIKLFEDLEPFYQPKLNPRVWGIADVNSAPKIHPTLRNRLLVIAQDFYEALKVEIPIEDIHLTGSLANYNWTKYSDFDVHVLFDFTKINEDTALVKKALDGQRFMWNQRHPVRILDHDVELYAQDISEPHIASGLYSLLKDEWITIPRFTPPSIDPKDVSRRVEALQTEIEMLANEISTSDFGLIQEPLISRVDWLKEKIMKARKDGLSERGEFSVENLTFKALRNSGHIEKLIDLGKEAYRKRHSDGNPIA
jgi:hypothetical protein